MVNVCVYMYISIYIIFDPTSQTQHDKPKHQSNIPTSIQSNKPIAIARSINKLIQPTQTNNATNKQKAKPPPSDHCPMARSNGFDTH